MRTTSSLFVLLTLALFGGCSSPVDEAPGADAVNTPVSVAPEEDAGTAAVSPDVLVASPDTVPATPDTFVNRTPVTTDCPVSLLANVYAPGTARLTAPFMGTDPTTIMIYMDGVTISRGSWGLADDGHTLVITQDVPGTHVVSFSVGCARVE